MDVLTIGLVSGLFCAGAFFGKEALGAEGLYSLVCGVVTVLAGFWPILRVLRIDRLPRCIDCGKKEYVASEGNPVIICASCCRKVKRNAYDQFEVLDVDGRPAVRLELAFPKMLGIWKFTKI